MAFSITRRTALRGLAATSALGIAALNARLAAQAAETEMEVVAVTPDLIARAKQEGRIMIRYASPVEIMTPIARDFEKQFGLSVQLDRKAGSLGNQQFATEERAGQHIMDVSYVTDPLGLKRLSAEGLYLHWTIADLEKKLPAASYVRGWGYCPQWTDVMIPYNPDVVAHAKAREIFKTWNGFLDPSLNGRVGLVEPAATNLAFLTYMMFFENARYGRDFFVKLAAQKPRLYSGSAGGREDIAAGATGTFIPHWESAAFVEFLNGSKVAWMYPDIAPSTAVNHIGISKNAPHPNAARLFAAWMFTEDGARAVQRSQTRSTLIGMPDDRTAIAKLRETEWWTPHRAENRWVPDLDRWAQVYPTMMPEMRRILGWRR